MNPLVSICIPTYNRASLLKCAIESAQRQTYSNIEIIVTDNCSTDNTESVVLSMSKDDTRIRYIRNSENIGPTLNWQVAVNAAKGTYCKILYSDDEIKENFITRCVDQFNNGEDVSFVVTDAMIGSAFDNASPWQGYCQGEGISPSNDFILNSLLWNTATVSPSCAMFRTEDLVSKIIIENPYFETNQYKKNGAGPDLLIFLNAALLHKEIAYIAKPLTLFRTSDDSFSMSANQSGKTLAQLIDGYVKARYQFLRNLAGRDQAVWYLRFLATFTGVLRNVSIWSSVAKDLELKNHLQLTWLDLFCGTLLRLTKNHVLKSRLLQILSAARIMRIN